MYKKEILASKGRGVPKPVPGRMSVMQQKDKVVAVLCSDIHLSQKAPRVRRGEPFWYEAMDRSLRQLKEAADTYKVPILCAGDVFDHWRVEPELISFAINCLPEMYAIPGQHDLPLHNMELITRSAFWTLVLAKKIHPVFHEKTIILENLVIHGFPYGTKITPLKKKSKDKVHVALCHDYFWMNNYGYEGASKKQKASAFKKYIIGYDAVAFGDNHKGFLTQVNDIPVINCGTFMRRTSLEEEYIPRIGLLCRSGRIVRHGLKVSKESFISQEEEEQGLRTILKNNDLEDFLVGLQENQDSFFDFMAAIEYAMESKFVNMNVRKLILQALRRDGYV